MRWFEGAALSARGARLLAPPRLPPPPALEDELERALHVPIGASPLAGRAVRRATVIVSDATRVEPRAEFLRAIRAHLPAVEWTLAIATGTHGPARIESLGIPPDWLRDARVVNHDGHGDGPWAELGTTARGTPVRVHPCVVDTELVIATGCIRPHYFAGFGAGCKALFPGLGEARAIRKNHELKREPRSRAGIVDGNPCREDLEEACALIPAPTFVLDGVCGPNVDGVDGAPRAVVAGDPARALRAGAALARPWFTVRAKPAALVLASDFGPVVRSLYQAAKIAAAMAPLVRPGGTLAIVASCEEGIEPIDVVNEAIFRIGVLPRLPAGARLALVSTLDRETVARTLLEFSPSIEALLERGDGDVLVVPTASQLLAEADS